MSSLNDGSGPPTSQNDSIPLEDEESSVSIYSDEEGEGSYVPSDAASDVRQSSLDYSSVSRTYLSQTPSRGGPVASEDYTGTASYYSNGEGGGGSNSYGYDDEYYEYSSGYDSMTYGDTSLRSPHSELSSTFASFYYENEFVVQTRATLRFLRRPLYYLAFASAGSGALGSVCRLATTLVRRHTDGGGGGGVAGQLSRGALSAVADGARRLPSGYPDMPAWLQEVRASLPAVMEVPAAWLLHRHQIPVLSEVVQAQQAASSAAAAAAAAKAGVSASAGGGVREAWQSWQKTGPAIPVALFLPLFSLVAIKVAQHVRPNPHSLTELLRAQQEAEDAEVASAYLSTTSPARQASVSASPIPAAPSSLATTSARSTVVDVPPTSRTTGSAAPQQPVVVPPVNISGVTSPEARQPFVPAAEGTTPPTTGVSPDSAEATRTRSRSATQAPQTHRHIADEAGVDIDVDTGARVESPPYDAALAKAPSPPPQAPPSIAGSAATTGSSAQARLGQGRGATLRGDVVAAIAGAPDIREANVALVAASRYGCSAVLLPDSLAGAAGLLEPPPSLDVTYVPDVVTSAVTLADRRGLTLLGITAQQWDAEALPLDTFVHPMNAVYLFVSQEADDAAAVAAVEEVVLRSVYVDTIRSELPANQVFYDRLLKEKAVR